MPPASPSRPDFHGERRSFHILFQKNRTPNRPWPPGPFAEDDVNTKSSMPGIHEFPRPASSAADVFGIDERIDRCSGVPSIRQESFGAASAGARWPICSGTPRSHAVMACCKRRFPPSPGRGHLGGCGPNGSFRLCESASTSMPAARTPFFFFLADHFRFMWRGRAALSSSRGLAVPLSNEDAAVRSGPLHVPPAAVRMGFAAGHGRPT